MQNRSAGGKMPSGAFDEEKDPKQPFIPPRRSIWRKVLYVLLLVSQGQAAEFEGCLIVWGLDEVEHQRKEGRIEWRALSFHPSVHPTIQRDYLSPRVPSQHTRSLQGSTKR